MDITTKITALATTILLSTALTSPANASESGPKPEVQPETNTLPITVPDSLPVNFERPAISTTPAPEVTPLAVEPVKAQSETVVQTPTVPTTPTPTPTTTTTPVQPPVSAPKHRAEEPAPATPSRPLGATIAAAALSQLGIAQDCTALVSNALAAAGINFHGWPAGYKSLGHIVPASQAQVGDLIYYDNAGAGVPHIAVYIGNGQAVHGGWNGGTTVVFSAYLGSGPQFIRVD